MKIIKIFLFLFLICLSNNKNCLAQEVEDDFFQDNSELEILPAIRQNQIKDPFEKINRKTFQFYQAFDIWLLSPVIKVYLKAPDNLRFGIANASSNLGEPITFINAILAFSVKDFVLSFNRFFLNSTFGFAGWDDYASRLEIFESKLEFSDIFRNLNIPEGPYFVSPFGGTSGNLIDALSFPQGIFMSPYSNRGHRLSTVNLSRVVGSVMSVRAKYDSVITTSRKDSVDVYITQRNFFLALKKSHKDKYDAEMAQQKATVLKNGTTYFKQSHMQLEYFA